MRETRAATWIEYLDAESDSLGRRSYILHWIADYNPSTGVVGPCVRGQCFRADPIANGHAKYPEGTAETARAALVREVPS